ncbi:hypothetical protein NHG31_06200 [Aerococcaceae bacterium NML171108]|nr:hypothetical protein [Aerococcaceae bacterium NML171108]
MKKSLVLSCVASVALALSIDYFVIREVPPSASYVYAAEKIDFNQGSMSDEEYINHIYQAFSKLDLIEMTTDSSIGDLKAKMHMLVDRKLDALKAAVESNGMKMSVYRYGKEVFYDPIVTLRSIAPMFQAADKDFDKKIEELATKMEGRIVRDEDGEFGSDLPDVEEIFVNQTLKFTSVEREGDIIRGVVDASVFSEAGVLGLKLPANVLSEAAPKTMFEVNAKAKTFKITSKISLPKMDELKEKASSMDEHMEENEALRSIKELIGFSVGAMFGDMESIVELKETTEKLQEVSELNPLTEDEFEQLKESLNLDF